MTTRLREPLNHRLTGGASGRTLAAATLCAGLYMAPAVAADPVAADDPAFAAESPADLAESGGPVPGSVAAPVIAPRVRNLISAVEPLWSDLSDSQREVLAAFESQWNVWPSDEKKIWVALATRFPTLPPQAKGKAVLRIREWAELSPAERLVARQNYQLARERDKGQRGKEWRRYQEMTPEQRSVLRDSGSVSNTAAGRTPPSGLAREASQPLSIKPVSNQPAEQ